MQNSNRNSLCVLVSIIVLSSGRRCFGQDLIAFGDSYIDFGISSDSTSARGGFSRWVQETLQTTEVFPSPPYVGGRYSNGPVWLEQAGQELGISIKSYGASGSTSGIGLSVAGALPNGSAGFQDSVKVLAPNLLQQLDQFYQDSKSAADPSKVYLIATGLNDYISAAQDRKSVLASQVVQTIAKAADSLFQNGARRFILVTIMPLQAFGPYFAQFADAASNWNAHNAALNETASTFVSSHPGSSMKVFNLGDEGLRIVQNPQQNGFSTADSCYNDDNGSVCSNPDEHVFWDSIHLTTAAYQEIAKEFVAQWEALSEGAGSAQASASG